MADGEILLITGALLVAALLSSTVAVRVRVPGLVAILGLGMLVGSEGLGWIEFSDYGLARTIGIIALVLILFEGGLAAGWPEIRPVLGPSISLATLGTLGTAVIVGFAAAWLFDLSTLEGLLIGAVVSSTDGAAIFALLRGSTLKRAVARTLEGEAGFNDPVAILLVLGFIHWITDPGYGLADMVGEFFIEMGIGLVVGVAVGRLATEGLTRLRLPSAGLYPVASVAMAALAFGLADTLHGSGFLAVYLTGLALGSRTNPASRTIATFHDGLAWVAQLALFLTLGLLVFPSQLGGVALEGTILALVMVFVARPVATFVATAFGPFDVRDRLILGWAGLRGAVPVVLATFAVTEGVPDSLEFFNIVFFAVLLSTILQGSTFEWLAAKLRATTDEAALPEPLVDPETRRRLGAEIHEFPVRVDDAVAGRRVRELGLPRDALLNLIIRGEQAIPPRGSTRVEVGDRLHVLVRQEVAVEFAALLRRWREGPVGAPVRARPRTATSTLFSTRPWRDVDGDAARPHEVAGIAVIEQLRTRRDLPGALVALADGRYAWTGPVVAIGPPAALQDAARRRLRIAADDAEQTWWKEVIGALAQPS